MSEDSGQEKTHEPTGKRIQDFREKGQVPRSQEVLTGFGLAFGMMTFLMAAPDLAQSMGRVLEFSFGRIENLTLDRTETHFLWRTLTLEVARVMLPLMGLLWVLMGLVSGIQGRGAMPKEPFKFDPQRFNVITLFQEKFLSPKPLVELVKSLIKLLVIGYLVWTGVQDRLSELPALVGAEPVALLRTFEDLVIIVLTRALPAAFLIAVLDYAYEWYRMQEKMKMTREEVKQEHKNSEGDPHIKSARRKRAMEIAMARTIQNVKKADVIITNPTHYAVALRYRKAEAPAPIVVAMGVDAKALKIRAEASRHDIPQIENRLLARALYAQCKEGRMIPEEMFGAVAKVLAVILRRRKARGQAVHR